MRTTGLSLLLGVACLASFTSCATPSSPRREASKDGDPLPLMRKAMQAHLAGDWEASNRELQQCLQVLQGRPQIRLGEDLGAAIFTEQLRAHEGEAYEQVFLHSLGMLNFAMMAKADEALVEARRSDQLQGWLRREGAALSDDPLARLLAAKLYEHQGHWDDARIDLEKAREAYRTGPMGLTEPSFLTQDLADLDERARAKPGPRRRAELWVLVYSGDWNRVPEAGQSSLDKAVFWAGKGPRANLEPVMDLVPLRDKARRSMSVGEALRATGRLAVRVAFLVGLAALGVAEFVPDGMLNGLGEGMEPDERHWDNLPAMIHAARLRLAPGTHTVHVAEDGTDGRSVSATVKVGAGSMSLIQVQMNGKDSRIHLSSYLRP